MGLKERLEKFVVKGGKREAETAHLELGVYEEGLSEAGVKRYIKAAELAGLTDIDELKKEIYAGNILVLDISQTSDEEMTHVEKAIQDLKIVVREVGGDIAGIGDDHVLVTPPGIKIDRQKLRMRGLNNGRGRRNRTDPGKVSKSG